MQSRLETLVVFSFLACGMYSQGQQSPAGTQANAGPTAEVMPVVEPTVTDHYRSSYVKLGGNASDALLYEPVAPGVRLPVAIVYDNSNAAPVDFYFDPPAIELASRGYRVLFLRHPVRPVPSPLDGFEDTSRGIAYMRTLPGVRRVVIAGWGAAATAMTLYADVAAHGPAACQSKEVIFPCKTADAAGLAKPDGLILFDAGLGAADKPFAVDPAYVGNSRSRVDVDMYLPANGYDPATGTATFSPEFLKKFFAAQSERNNKIIDDALARMKVLEQSKGSADEPLIVPGTAGTGSGTGVRMDLNLMSHSKQAHPLLKADGSQPVVILQAVRANAAPTRANSDRSPVPPVRPVAGYSLQRFLDNDAVRTTKDYALTEDDLLGVEWKTSNFSTPGVAEGVTVPTLMMSMTCFRFIVPSEITFDHLASKDKSLIGVEGAGHPFTPCAPQYGDTQKRTFDYVAGWLAKPVRF